ncbi:MAG TPA: hypothetical protein VI485_13640 [Vicinamibacterales bacterium]|nr:hypothetical protein [Vicinamibacterales bacterium]
MTRLPDGERVRTYLVWAGWVGVAFFAVYPTMNWLTSLRSQRLHLYAPQELALPLVPQFIWPYLSLYALFLAPPFFLPVARMPSLGKQLIAGTLASGVLFLLFPAELGFVRAVPVDTPYASVFAAIFSVDRPYNLVPSLHIVYATAIASACAEVAGPLVRRALFAWLAMIAAATLLVHQHHVVDVITAFALVILLRRRYGVTYV